MKHFMNVFAHTNASMQDEREVEKSMEGQNPNEVKFNNFSGGDSEEGQRVFDQISKTVADRHENFYFKEQEDQQTSSNQEKSLIKKVKQNPNK